MNNFFKSKFGTILVLLATVVLAGIAIFTAFRLYKLRQEAITPNAPTSKPAAATAPAEPTASPSVCPALIFSIEPTGTATATATSTSTATATATATSTSTATATATATGTAEPNSCGGTCGSNSNCGSGFVCSAGYCRNSSCTSETDCICPTTNPTGTSNPTNSPVGSQASLPEAGTSLPSILGLGIGGILLIVSLLLAL